MTNNAIKLFSAKDLFFLSTLNSHRKAYVIDIFNSNNLDQIKQKKNKEYYRDVSSSSFEFSFA